MPNGDSTKKIFSHKMWEGYTWVPFGHFDLRNNDNRPFIDGPKSKSFNADDLAE